MSTTLQERVEQFSKFLANDQISRNRWHTNMSKGTWPWFAELTVGMNDNGTPDLWSNTVTRWTAILPGLPLLDKAAERRCLAKTMITILTIVLPYDTNNVVAPVIALWQRDGTSDAPTEKDWQLAATKAAAQTPSKVAGAAAAGGATMAAAAAIPGSRRAVVLSASLVCLALPPEKISTAWDQITDCCLTAIESEITKGIAPRTQV